MSKTVAAAVGAASVCGLATASVGGAYAMGAFNEPERGIGSPTSAEDLYQWNGGECNYFTNGVPVLNFKEKSDSKESQLTIDEQNFFTGESEKNARLQSCLIVDWNKKKYKKDDSDHRWTGSLNFLWSLAKGNRGFMFFTWMEARDSKIFFSGSAYALEKPADSWWRSGTWRVIGSKTKELEEMKSEDVNSKFPRSFSVHDGIYPKWKFLSDADTYDKIKGPNDDLEEDEGGSSYFQSRWEFEPESQTQPNALDIASWSPNFVSWFDLLYDADRLQIPRIVTSMTGTWKSKHLEGNPKPSLKASGRSGATNSRRSK